MSDNRFLVLRHSIRLNSNLAWKKLESFPKLLNNGGAWKYVTLEGTTTWSEVIFILPYNAQMHFIRADVGITEATNSYIFLNNAIDNVWTFHLEVSFDFSTGRLGLRSPIHGNSVPDGTISSIFYR